MNYRSFGRLDWKPSALGFGTMRLPTLGDDPSAIDEKLAIDMLRTGIDAGINYIDTAYPYHGGKSEVLVGKALEDGYRRRVHLATKMPSWLIETSQDMTMRFNEQLSRMKTDHVDFYLLHALNAERWHKLRDAGVIEWSLDRIREGSIRYLGFSFHDTNTAFHEIVDAYQDWTFCQIQYNFLDEQIQAGTEGLRYAASKGMGVVVMEPLRGGKLATPNEDIVNLWHNADPSRTPAEWALDWVWNHTEVSLLLSGMSTLQQVQQNLEAADHAQPAMLTCSDLATVARVRDAYAALTRVPCTGCRYCMPCPHGVDIPGVFELANEGSMFGRWDVQRKRYERMRTEKTSADQCVRCGLCETKCPQHIGVTNELAAVDRELA